VKDVRIELTAARGAFEPPKVTYPVRDRRTHP
jgi:hypothetical protein